MQMTTARLDSEKFRRDLCDLWSQIAQLEMRCDAQSEELDSAENELRGIESLVEEKDRIIATLTAQVDHEKCAHATMEEQVDAERRYNEKLQGYLEALSSHIADLKQRYDAQEEAIRDELQSKASLLRHPINFLATAFMQAQSEDRAKAEQFATARRDLERLLYELMPSILERMERGKSILDVAQVRELDYERSEWTSPPKRAPRSRYSRDYMARWFSAEWLDSEESKKLPYPRTLPGAASKIAELQMRRDAQSKQLDSVWHKIEANDSLVYERDRTIATLPREVDRWKRAVATMAEHLAAVRKVKESLLRDLAAFSPRITFLQQYYDKKSKAIRAELQTHTSLLEHTITFLTTAFTQAQSEDGAIATVRSDLEQLRCVFSELMTSLHARYAALPQELQSVRDELHSIEILYPGLEDV
jgi:chromosome segregation ATPase